MVVSATSLGVIGTQGAQNPTGADAFQDMDMQSFIKLLVAELSNQDPMNPMENSEILQQISQMREIASNDLLTKSLEAIKMGQNVATASALIGQTIDGLTDGGNRVIGEVDRISLESGVPKLHVGDYVVDMRNVAGIAASVEELDLGEETEETAEEDDGTNEKGQA